MFARWFRGECKKICLFIFPHSFLMCSYSASGLSALRCHLEVNSIQGVAGWMGIFHQWICHFECVLKTKVNKFCGVAERKKTMRNIRSSFSNECFSSTTNYRMVFFLHDSYSEAIIASFISKKNWIGLRPESRVRANSRIQIPRMNEHYWTRMVTGLVFGLGMRLAQTVVRIAMGWAFLTFAW